MRRGEGVGYARISRASGETRRRTLESPAFTDSQLPAVFGLLGRVGEAVVATVGRDCEVVVHDLRNPRHSVVAISGELTGRHVGAPAPDPELLPGVVDKFTGDQLRRHTTTSSGRELVSSTAWLRGEAGHIVGAVCINLDLAELRRARDIIDGRLVSDDGLDLDRLTTFAPSVADFTRIAVQDVLRGVAKPLHQLTRNERIDLVRSLDRAGVFAMRGAVPSVAGELGVSRATVYTYLREAQRLQPAANALSPKDLLEAGFDG